MEEFIGIRVYTPVAFKVLKTGSTMTSSRSLEVIISEYILPSIFCMTINFMYQFCWTVVPRLNIMLYGSVKVFVCKFNI